jgi:hypothetical protein
MSVITTFVLYFFAFAFIHSLLATDYIKNIVCHPLYLAGIILIFTKPEMTLLDITAAALVSIYFIPWMISELGVSSKAPFRGLLLSSDCSAPGITPL